MALGILKRMGCTNVLTAEDGEAALEALHAAGGPDAFDVILTDLHMPRKVKPCTIVCVCSGSGGALRGVDGWLGEWAGRIGWEVACLACRPACLPAPSLTCRPACLPRPPACLQGGLEAVRDIRRTWSRYRTKIIAVTADAFEDTRDKCIACGFDGWLAKPFRVEEFARVLSVCRSGGSLTPKRP